MMRGSLWLLFAAATALALFWVLLVLTSGFEVWRESNRLGLTVQAALLLYPLGLLAALKRSSESWTGTLVTFVIGWSVAAAALVFFGLP